MLRRIVLGLAVVVGSTSAFSSPHISALSHSVGQSSAKLISHVGALTARSGLKRPILAMGLFGMGKTEKGMYPITCGEDVMKPKAHGTSEKPVQKNLRWGCDYETSDRICNFNRHYAEFAGYWTTTKFMDEVDKTGETTYYDSVTGVPLFIAPRGRSFEDFVKESNSHGWPSFRDEEVVWENVRCLSNGEAISTTGTHLGHNLPDRKGNRYCINLVSVAGRPDGEAGAKL